MGLRAPEEDGAGRASEVALVVEDVASEAEAGTLDAIVGSSEDANTSETLAGVLTGWNPGARKAPRVYRRGGPRPNRLGGHGSTRGPELALQNIERAKRGEVVGPFDAVRRPSRSRPGARGPAWEDLSGALHRPRQLQTR